MGYEYACVVNTIHTAALHKTGGDEERERERARIKQYIHEEEMNEIKKIYHVHLKWKRTTEE